MPSSSSPNAPNSSSDSSPENQPESAPENGGLRRPRQDRSRLSLDRMLDAAEALIIDHGVEGLTLAAMFHRSKVSNGTFYARFSGKDALVHEVLNRALERMERSVTAACEPLARPAVTLPEAVAGVVAALGGEFREKAGLFGAFMSGGPGDEPMRRRVAETHSRIEVLMRRVLTPRLPPTNRHRAERLIATAHHVLVSVMSERVTAARGGTGKHKESWEEMQAELAALLTGYLGWQPADRQESPPPAGTPPLSGGGEEPVVVDVPDPEDEAPPASRRGRAPKGQAHRKIDQILAAARRLFTRQGFEATSMVQVAAEAKVGKATVYAHFSNKAELLAAVVASESHLQLTGLLARPSDDVPATLRRFGRQAFDLLLNASTLSKLRMIVAEAERFPELGAIFYTAGPARLRDGLADFLADAMARGVLRAEDPQIAAAQFLAIICGDLRLQSLVGTAAAIGPGERERVLVSGVEAFLRAYQPEPPQTQN